MPIPCCCCCCPWRSTKDKQKLPPYTIMHMRPRPLLLGKCKQQSNRKEKLFINVAEENRFNNFSIKGRMHKARMIEKLSLNKVAKPFTSKLKSEFNSETKVRPVTAKESSVDRDPPKVSLYGADFEALEEKEREKSIGRKQIEGYLLKFTNVVKGFQYRWVALDPVTGLLEYFEKEEYKKQRPRGSIYLAAAFVSPSEEDSQTFVVNSANGEVFKLRAADAKERQLWVDKIRFTAEYHTSNMASQGSPRLAKKQREEFLKFKGSQESLNLPKLPRGNSVFQEVKEYYTEAEDFSKTLEEKIACLPHTGEYLTSLDTDLLLLKATSAATLQCIQECIAILQYTEANSLSTHSGRKSLYHQSIASINSTTETPEPLPEPNDEEEDVSEFQEAELKGVEENKSVILHLLSQLKLGMDLTKVVLPTFILEKRSLLEMFADCMGDPEAFLRIADKQTPEKRMIAVLEWFLTSLYSGKKGSVAKKPYNPIIGETFHCSWRATPSDRVTFTAEQVSHHPPISAFYVNSDSKQMKLNASIYTRSKFMGMSIGVVMVGKVRLLLEKYNELYTFTLPSAYARSILTTPWIELGDKVTMNCEDTGYTANVVFHTKPFYGGKLHHITADIKHVSTGQNVCKVTGEWNSVLEFSFSDGSSKTIDVKTMKTKHKHVRPLEKQCEFESRRLWHHVTTALTLGDIQTATEHKKMLEEIQREGEKHRKERNIQYPAKYFRKVNETWLYKSVPESFLDK